MSYEERLAIVTAWANGRTELDRNTELLTKLRARHIDRIKVDTVDTVRVPHPDRRWRNPVLLMIVYVYWNNDLKTYYVGQTQNESQRIKSHGNRWIGYEYMVLRSELTQQEANDTERLYISQAPSFCASYTVLNKRDGPL